MCPATTMKSTGFHHAEAQLPKSGMFCCVE
jgi:hypothetical protein